MSICYLLLGGNLGNREENLRRAQSALEGKCGHVRAVSGLYETEAWGVGNQPPFLNRALKLETSLTPEQLLEAALAIEESMGRIRGEKFGPRTIDIDLLLYDQLVLNLPDLVIPHPFLHRRRFALQCLADIAPDLVHPVLGFTVSELLAACDDPLAVYKL